ncbi:hypothetical protein MYCTH_2106715 [Thermothelomyces thermophilus ATCC 42464]|uniref:Uncharacterized protein n=1 Tax=Thermothelomyces thermophilus (strain ATCC 42464 / BCRC 31852 / DSM 1799) TaxID=573729 RepID=G2Q6V4_THET4|nr:uncharacterized protein MYCTH_2106715 [Thermothelomyces thermophilus ATCC 42464]AEO53932.1 hypothetical protein MYCTH_2106715 [Thermothelomyces thermophilus ATCC 42464]
MAMLSPRSSLPQSVATGTQQQRLSEEGARPEETQPTLGFPLEFPLPLPANIAADILARSLRRAPRCALDLLCPEWSLCRRPNRALEAVLRTTRVDTYTLPCPEFGSGPGPAPAPETGTGPETGQIETAFDHDPAKCEGRGRYCILLEVVQDPREVFGGGGGGGGSLPRDLQRELVRRWAGGSVVVVSQRREPPVLGPLWARDLRRKGDDEEEKEEGGGGGGGKAERIILREERAVGLVPYEDDFVIEVGGRGGEEEEEEEEEQEKGRAAREMVCGVDWYEKDALPAASAGDAEGGTPTPVYLFGKIRHLVVNCVPALARVEAEDLGMMPATRCAQTRRNLEYLEERLEYERRAHLRVRWDAMERLETLCLDLRGFSMPEHGYLDVEDVLQLARSLRGKRLKLLVIAGLRSFRSYHGFDPEKMADVEEGTWNPRLGAWVSKKKGVGINWWKMFEGAVRPGGRLVFVDKSNADGLLPPGAE